MNPHTHFITKCICGKIVNQCRCPDPNKAIRISGEPCPHGALVSRPFGRDTSGILPLDPKNPKKG